MGSFSPSQDPSPLGCDQHMMPSPQEDSLTSSPDGHVSLTHSMIRDISTSSMDTSLMSPSSPPVMSNNNNNGIPSPGQLQHTSNNNNESLYSPSNGHGQNMQHQQSLINVIEMGAGDGGGLKKYPQATTTTSTVNNNNNYLLNSNQNNSVEYVAHHSPQQQQQMHQQPQMGEYSGAVMGHMGYSQQVASPRNDRSPTSISSSNNSSNTHNHVSHKISVKCASELIHGAAGGLMTSFKEEEPEHRY